MTGDPVNGQTAAHAFTLDYLEQHSGIHPTISAPIVVITKKANVKFIKVEEALKEMRN